MVQVRVRAAELTMSFAVRGMSSLLLLQVEEPLLTCLREGKGLRRRNYPKGYAEMLERQQFQLVSCIQELYQRLNKAELWKECMPDSPKNRPLTHDILAALNLLEPKDDGSGDLESFNDIVGLSRSAPEPPTSDGPLGVNDQQDNSTSNEYSPILLPEDDDTSVFAGTLALAERSAASSDASSPVDQTITWPQGHPGHSHFSTQAVQTQPLLAEANYAYGILSMAQSAPRDMLGSKDSANLYGAQNDDWTTNSAIFAQPSLLKTNKISPDVRAPLEIDTQLSLGHRWPGSGIGFDSSDFHTDFHEFSPLGAPPYLQNIAQKLP